MKLRLTALVLFSVLFAGSYSIGGVPTEKMQVKQKRVNGVDLAYVEEGQSETVDAPVFASAGRGAEITHFRERYEDQIVAFWKCRRR